jgi:hypothetical protein
MRLSARLSVQPRVQHVQRIAAALALCATAFLPTASPATVFEARTSGLCTDKSGWAWVGSQAECEEAARAKGWPDTDAEDRSYKKLTIRVGLMPNLSTVVSLGGKATVRAPW